MLQPAMFGSRWHAFGGFGRENSVDRCFMDAGCGSHEAELLLKLLFAIGATTEWLLEQDEEAFASQLPGAGN